MLTILRLRQMKSSSELAKNVIAILASSGHGIEDIGVEFVPESAVPF